MADSEPDLTQEFIKYMEDEMTRQIHTYKPLSSLDAITVVSRMIRIFDRDYVLGSQARKPIVHEYTTKHILYFSSQIAKLAHMQARELGGAEAERLTLVIQAAKAIGDAASANIKAGILPAIEAAASAILKESADAANEAFENQVKREVGILMDEKAKSTEDAVPKVVKLIKELCKTDNPLPEQVKHYADLIEKIAQNIDETIKTQDKETHDNIRFFIQAAKTIQKSADIKLNAQAEAGKPTSVSVFNRSGSSAPVSARLQPPSQAPPSTSEFQWHHHADMGGIAGGRRSRTNVRRSYNRSINKSVAKKLKRFISRKY